MSTRASRVPTPVSAESVSNGSNGSQRNSIVLGPNDRLRGELYVEGDLRVAGTVEGNIEATGDIEIAGAGKVNGDVVAYNRLTVGSDASLIAGDVRVARLTVEDGATFSGKVSMGKPQKKAEKPPEPKPEPVAVAELTPAVEPAAIAEPEPIAVEPVAAKAVPVKAAAPVKSAPVKSVPIKQQQKGRRR